MKSSENCKKKKKLWVKKYLQLQKQRIQPDSRQHTRVSRRNDHHAAPKLESIVYASMKYGSLLLFRRTYQLFIRFFDIIKKKNSRFIFNGRKH